MRKLRKDHLLNDRYLIKAKIGGGGMADVYLARDIILERDVAVKQLRTEYAHDQEFIARFDREAQSATSLSHPNIVSIYDVGEEDDLLYMVMEYVEGMTLKEYIKEYGPLPVEEAIDIMKQIASAIQHAHANNIIHRDIKPQNILMDHYGNVKVTDFGIAVALSATALTQTNSILGSVHYLSPEQARGGMATKKSDIYSLGIVFFELLTGRLPFSGQSPVSIALKHLQSETPSVRRFNQDIPQSVENIVLKATAKNPFHRYETIYDLEEALDTALDPDKLHEPPFTPPEEAGEETKAIPIITDNEFKHDYDQETIVHHGNGETKEYEDNQTPPPANKKNKKKKSKKKNGKKQKRKRWLLIGASVLMLFLAAIVVLFIYPGILLSKEVTMPDVIEMEAEEARDLLEELGLVVEEERIPSEEIEEGFVVRTSPKSGRTVKTGSAVTLFISEGKEKIVFGDYTGQDFSQVKRLLEREGFTDIVTYEVYSEKPVGEIITQLQPAPESEVVPSETKVIFEISKGPELVQLTDLSGMTVSEAKQYLENNNLRMNVIEENSDVIPEGAVIRQSPKPGTNVQENTTVDVYVSKGKEQRPPISHSVTYTVPYTLSADGEGEERPEQVVRIYIGDVNNDISEVYEERAIKEDTEFTFTLTIPEGGQAEYIITRDDEVLTNRVVTYEEGE